MGKIGPFRKSRKVFLAHPKWAERFFRTQKNFFSNKNAMKVKKKVQQKRPKTQERRAFENLSAHFECAENLSSIPKRTECCK
jgi:hypothetical protein